MKKKNLKSLPKLEDIFKEHLNTPKTAAIYLSEALRENDYEYFLMSLKDVVKANGGFTALANKLSVSRSSLYKSLSPDTKVGFIQLHQILKAIDINLRVEFKTIKKQKKVA